MDLDEAVICSTMTTISLELLSLSLISFYTYHHLGSCILFTLLPYFWSNSLNLSASHYFCKLPTELLLWDISANSSAMGADYPRPFPCMLVPESILPKVHLRRK